MKLRLARLAQEDVHQLAASLGVTDPSTMTMLEERADGLPFMVEELSPWTPATYLPPCGHSCPTGSRSSTATSVGCSPVPPSSA